MRKESGFTLLEIIIATIILSLTILGLLGVFVAGNNWVLHLRERSTSAELGKLFVDPLQMDVRQDTWTLGSADNSLTIGTTYCNDVAGDPQNKDCPALDRRRINNKPFDVEYNIDSPAVLGGLRRVKTTVRWTEAVTAP